MKENSPNLVKDIDIQVQQAQRIPNKINPKRPTQRHIIIKKQMLKTKNLKSNKRKGNSPKTVS